MKKMIALVLALLLVFGLAACGSAGAASKTTTGTAAPGEQGQGENNSKDELLVGYARVSITPMYSVPLGGYGNTSSRMSDGYQMYLYTTCVAYSDGEDTVLMFNNDLVQSSKAVIEPIRQRISNEYGIPMENIVASASHTHSAPDINSSEPSIAQYRKDLSDWMVEAAGEALEDLKPVTGMYHGSITAEGLNFVRHYTTESGIVKGDNLNSLVDSPYTGHLSDADNVMQVIRIDREGADSVVLVNWQSHPHRGGGAQNRNITSDIVGVLREYVEAEVDGVQVAYYSGASGNINPRSNIEKENITANYKEQGKALGEYAVKILEGEMTQLSGTNVQVTGQVYVGQVNHSEDHLLDVAKIVAEEWAKTNDVNACTILANSYGLNSPYHANGIVRRAGSGQEFEVPMYAFSVGDIGFAAAPYEMFDKQGVTIKENSPFAATFVLTLANEGLAYIPDRQGFEINCYEANNCVLVPGTGETLADEYVKLLEGLYATK